MWTGVIPRVDSLPSAVGSWQTCLQKDLWQVKMGASVFSSINMGFWSEILYPTGFPVKSQKLNIWAQCPSWKTAQTLWILVSISGSHRVFSISGIHCLKNRNNKGNYQMLFYSKENQVSFSKLAVIFSFCISLKRHAREIIFHSCLSFETLCASQFSSPTRLFDQRLLTAL